MCERSNPTKGEELKIKADQMKQEGEVNFLLLTVQYV